MKFTTETGILLDDESDRLTVLKGHIKYCGLDNIRIFLATDPNGVQSYLLVDGSEPIYESQIAEAVWCHLDMLKANRDM